MESQVQETARDITDLLGREPTEQERGLISDYESGAAYKLTRKIGRVSIDHPSIIKAFREFTDNSGEEMKFFRLLDLLSYNESICKGSFSYGNPGDFILCLSKMPQDKKLIEAVFASSVNGLYELIDRTNGFALDLSAFPDQNIETLLGKRFVFADKKRTDKLIRKAAAVGITVHFFGIVTEDKRIVITRNGIGEVDMDKDLLLREKENETHSVALGKECFEEYKKGFLSVLGYKYGLSASFINPILVGTDIDAAHLLAELLGIFSALRRLFMCAVRLIPVPGKDISFSFSFTPGFAQEHKLFMLTPSCDSSGIPAPVSYDRINTYLANLRARGVLKAVLPILPSIGSALKIIEHNSIVLEPAVDFSLIPDIPCSVLVIYEENIDGRLLGTLRSEYN